ncbi:beta-lactamase-like protein [Chlamydoabsidia padenii]|nr:beta-lactamase-like protein [Chlamydoabsidia padenii]
MSTLLRFLGHSTSEGPPTILYQHNGDQYMFNCREGTQRLIVEDKVKVSKLNSIFFTRLQWECTGGMPGMLLTLADAGLKKVDLYGSKNLTHLMASTRFFVYRNTMTVQTKEYLGDSLGHPLLHSTSETIDKSLKVIPVVILPRWHHDSSQQTSSSSDYIPSDNPYSTPKPDFDQMINSAKDQRHLNDVLSFMFSNSPKIKNNNNNNNPGGYAMDAPCTPRQHPLANETTSTSMPAVESPEAIIEIKQKSDTVDPQAMVTPIKQDGKERNAMMELYTKDLPRTRTYPSVISYICQTPQTRGKFRQEKAISLGVPVGRLFGELQRGNTVTLENGTVVTHTQVCDSPTPGSIFIVVDCPGVAYVDDLINSPKFNDYQTQTNTQNIPKVIIHLLGKGVLNQPKYRQWMNTFSRETEHIISSEDICTQSALYRSHAIYQYKLSKLDPTIFKLPEYNNIPATTLDQYDDLPPKVSPLKNKSVYNLQETRKMKIGSQEIDNSPLLDVNRSLGDPKISEFDGNVEYQKAIQEAKEAASQVNLGEPFPGHDVQVVTLGTGSSIHICTLVSATLVKIPKFGSVLLDAGEGTYGQMLRHFGQDNILKELDDLRCIFVSHLHADHHLGVFQLLIKRKQAGFFIFKYL